MSRATLWVSPAPLQVEELSCGEARKLWKLASWRAVSDLNLGLSDPVLLFLQVSALKTPACPTPDQASDPRSASAGN